MDWAAEEFSGLLQQRKPHLLLVTDERVALHYLQPLQLALSDRGFNHVSTVVLPVGESSKTLANVSQVLDRLAADAFARDDLVIALGGGVITDLAGFAAAIYQRGMPWIAVPTTLLGMVDAAIGGKTGVDHPLGKNLIGAFHQPKAVLIPFDVLKTLDEREWISGSAEVVKAGMLAGGELWKVVQQFGPNLYHWPRGKVYETIVRSAAFKISVVASDEKETGRRKILNLGHTFGHAIESATDYLIFKHGEAVFLGLRAAVHLSEAQKLLSPARAAEIETILERIPFPKADLEPHALLEAIQRDKKITDGRLHWILSEGIGKPIITADVTDEAARQTARWLSTEMFQGSPSELQARRLRVLVINGPNLNMLGEREPEIYGTLSYEQLCSRLQGFAEKHRVFLIQRHSNIEGEIVDMIQQTRHWADGIVINAGGYTHTSVAIRDALSAVTLPAIEVHLSDISKREDFRRESLISPVCAAQIMGKGVEGYEEAVLKLVDLNHNLTLAMGKQS